jgi:hypothetical protein
MTDSRRRLSREGRSGFQMTDSRWQIQEDGVKIPDPGFKVADCELKMTDSRGRR